MTPTLRQEIEQIAARLEPGLAPPQASALRGELVQVAIRAGQMEQLADEMVADAMEKAMRPVHVPPSGVVVQFPRRTPVEVRR